MNLDEFWNLIEQSRAGGTECEEQAEKLTELLAKLPPQEIKSFDLIFGQRMAESYRWDWWAVGYIVNGGCSDDGFDYFRAWVIAQGRAYYEAALQEATRAGDAADPESDEHECEDIMTAAFSAYMEVTGKEMPIEFGEVAYPPKPLGEAWDENDLPRLYPELCRRFSWEN